MPRGKDFLIVMHKDNKFEILVLIPSTFISLTILL